MLRGKFIDNQNQSDGDDINIVAHIVNGILLYQLRFRLRTHHTLWITSK
jgi:hypothetical protein